MRRELRAETEMESHRDTARVDEDRTAVIRDRIERGFYRGDWVRAQIARRLLASGDLTERTGG